VILIYQYRYIEGMKHENELYPDFYSVSDFAKKLRVHPNTIRRAIRRHKITAVRFGTEKRPIYRIPHSEVERILIIDLETYIQKLVNAHV
jgi:excisionase family DNA binding protein